MRLLLSAIAVTLSLIQVAQGGDSRRVEAQEVKDYFSDHAGHFNIGCMLEHCLVESLACIADKGCREAIVCDQKCMDEWDSDTTKGKFHIQNCTNICAWTYVDASYQTFLQCITNSAHPCLTFPPIPNTCRAPNIHPLKQLSVKDLQGDWWVVKGLHPVYDCYPCQKIYYSMINETSWNYSSYYQVYQANGSISLAYLQTVVPTNMPGGNISMAYDDIGLIHYETWWLLDKNDEFGYILLYYCGNTLQWYYEGAQVLSRNATLNESAYSQIATSYQQAVGLKLSDFTCNTGTKDCPERKKAMWLN